ncbi:MAG: N-6 DNA methylase [bacterium]|nr:N-6 DNA methylase [bacterium]
MLQSYVSKLQKVAEHGDAREENFYSALEQLLTEYAASTHRKNVYVTTLPKKTEAGNPDFRIWDGKQHITGYIEAKAPSVEHLDRLQHSEQLMRYRTTFPNLLLTNFLEFRLYRNGELVKQVQIGRPYVLQQLKTTPPIEYQEEFFQLLNQFFAFAFPRVYTAKGLATELAKRTRFLRDEIVTLELTENDRQESSLAAFYDAFRTYLIGDLSPQDFADLYSQTIAYGLFAARTRAENGFNRKLAYDYIPRTIGILRDIFRFISLGDLPKPMEWILDDISEILAITDVKQLLHHYFHEGKGADPIIHFYETFLAEYDPSTRERRGVYYTPDPVVSYIIRSIHILLKDVFQRPYGLADESVTVLDPSAGTLTFLAEAAKVAADEYTEHWGTGGIKEFIKHHILQQFYAFELMMAPYAVGHLKMAFFLEELGYRLQDDDRVQLYLTNTLEMEELAQITLPGMKSISEESQLAREVKTQQPILVIFGNPPYSGQSANTGRWITNSIKGGETLVEGVKDDGYYHVDGKPLGEKNPKWLLDDYVKFLRFAQCKIEQAGQGIVGFITNHSYLNNPTFRGMRRSLMKSFDEIYVFDLHGNSLKKETCPDGSKDENVFDIRQGVAIVFLLKRPETHPQCQVHHAELWGLREEKKYPELRQKTLNTTPWQDISPQPQSYLFVPRDEQLFSTYQTYSSLSDIFLQRSVGIATARDNLALQWTPRDVWTTILNFSKLDPEIARTAYHLGKDARDWKVKLAQHDLLESGLEKEKIIPLYYRPFDVRYTYYTGKSRGFHCMPRGDMMRHILAGSNLCLTYTRSTTAAKPFTHIFCAQHGIIARFYPDAACVPYFSPLHVYPEKNLFNHTHEAVAKEPNLDPKLIKKLAHVYGTSPTPEEIFYYMYGVLYAPTYRSKYAEFLSNDFPRVPFTTRHDVFCQMIHYGQELVEYHLLTSADLNPPLVKFQGTGENRIDKVSYQVQEQSIAVNSQQYFAPVSSDVWNYEIAGYQVCRKWLQARKGRQMAFEEIKQYCQITTAISKTLQIQQAIDRLYSEVESEVAID